MEINKRKTKTNSWENECDENELLKEFETEAMEYYYDEIIESYGEDEKGEVNDSYDF